MFILKKLITPFVIPPGLFITILFFVGFFLVSRKKRSTGISMMVVGVLTWICSTAPLANLLFRGLEAEFQFNEDPAGDVIVLLGGGINEQAPDLSGEGAPSDLMLTRIVTTARLQKKLDIPVIATGGGLRNTEARVAKRFLVDLGVPGEKILLEEQARDTYENAKYAKAICRRMDFQNPIIVTSGFHLRRARDAFQTVGLEVIAFPADLQSSDNPDFSWMAYLPSAGQLLKVSRAFHEYLGLVYYGLVY